MYGWYWAGQFQIAGQRPIGQGSRVLAFGVEGFIRAGREFAHQVDMVGVRGAGESVDVLRVFASHVSHEFGHSRLEFKRRRVHSKLYGLRARDDRSFDDLAA